MDRALAACPHSPSLSNYRCDLHILLNAVSILLFGIISPLPLLEMNKSGDAIKETRQTAHIQNISIHVLTNLGSSQREGAIWMQSSLVDGVRRGQTISGSRKRLSVGQRWESSCSVARLFHVHHWTADPLHWLEKAIPAVSLSESDLRSLCSKITAPSSATVLMHMKQNGWMVRTGRTHGCTRTHACAGRRQTSGAPAI